MKNKNYSNPVDTKDFQALSSIVIGYIASIYSRSDDRDVYIEDSNLITKLKDVSRIPDKGTNPVEVLNDTLNILHDGFCNVQSSGYYGYISSRPLLISIIGDFLASASNQTAGAWRAGPSATVIENETLKWIAEFVGYNTATNEPAGIITSGGTMANASALKLARDTRLGRYVQHSGLRNVTEKPAIYLSEQGHFSIKKSLDFLGLGKNSLQIIEVNPQGQIDIAELEKTIKSDIEEGIIPICIVGTAGTTGTGAIDDLEALARLAKKYDMWFHVDAAAGGVYGNHPDTRKYFTGLDLADSVTIDPCKWLFVPFGIGCLLVKKPKELYESFSISANYWEEKSDLDFFQMSFPGTRQWRTLGLWMAFKSLGTNGYHKILEDTLKLKNHLVDIIEESSSYEVLERPLLPVCCFRYISAKTHLSLNELNELLCTEVNRNNKHHVTLMDHKDTIYLRVAFSNVEASTESIDELIACIESIVEKLAP